MPDSPPPIPEPRTDLQLNLPGGRILSYAEYGNPTGTPSFYFHGHPGSRFEGLLGHAAAFERNLRVVALDRPGYGLSTFQDDRTILDWPHDVAAAADVLGFERFSVAGGSGGGPYALACGYAMPERLTKVGVISGVGPYSAKGVTKGMRWQNRLGFQWGARIPPLAGLLVSSMGRQVEKSPERVVDAVAKAMSGPDAAVVQRPEVRDALVKVVSEAFRQGSRGAARDVVLLGRDWGFKPRLVTAPVVLWQGEADTLVPPAMGRYLAAQLPNCQARFFPGEGHLLVVNHLAELYDEFAAAT